VDAVSLVIFGEFLSELKGCWCFRLTPLIENTTAYSIISAFYLLTCRRELVLDIEAW